MSLYYATLRYYPYYDRVDQACGCPDISNKHLGILHKHVATRSNQGPNQHPARATFRDASGYEMHDGGCVLNEGTFKCTDCTFRIVLRAKFVLSALLLVAVCFLSDSILCAVVLVERNYV